jgi:glutamate N-acetyltransferase/amino-acid N-acetyltransferase
MAVGLELPSKLIPVNGLRLFAASANIYNKDRDDVVLIELCESTVSSAVFTKNKFCAAPVIVAKANLSSTAPRYCLINAGNANAGTGELGIANAKETCQSLSLLATCEQAEVLPFSTGVIGEDLPIENIKQVLPELLDSLSDNAWLESAQAIMTTDTIAKAVSKQITIEDKTITITGMAKGSGMIKPNMATMLSFIATDANVSKNALDEILLNAVNKSFNRITVDGDTSTNDACVLFATAKANNSIIESNGSNEYLQLQAAIVSVCQQLAQAIVRDGEGASKFISVQVNEGKNEQECLAVAYKIAESPLVKTAFTASDPNWGRILAAVGNAGIDDLDIDNISIYLDDVCIVENGCRSQTYTEEDVKKVMLQEEIKLSVCLNRGENIEEVWTTDLSHEYITINAEYRT